MPTVRVESMSLTLLRCDLRWEAADEVLTRLRNEVGNGDFPAEHILTVEQIWTEFQAARRRWQRYLDVQAS